MNICETFKKGIDETEAAAIRKTKRKILGKVVFHFGISKTVFTG